MTDASQKAWGSQVSRDLDSESTRQVQGCREANMTPSSSNLRELSAVLLSLMAFLRIIRDKSVQEKDENVINKIDIKKDKSEKRRDRMSVVGGDLAPKSILSIWLAVQVTRWFGFRVLERCEFKPHMSVIEIQTGQTSWLFHHRDTDQSNFMALPEKDEKVTKKMGIRKDKSEKRRDRMSVVGGEVGMKKL
ncbi:hypothetical protein RRG08_050469 [Elysia crispata]|uniref:Uncharacterized protein n=1 Tax=Elysia crispata TaxID=231223 RepID=A0AAE1EDJ7_9GAST|nr:hypothetical protein RRG08_050469 [Elysia crispata]